MNPSQACLASLLLPLAMALCACSATDGRSPKPLPASAAVEEDTMLIQYLEVVTPNVDATCSALEKVHGVSFEQPIPGLGNARTATLKSGGKIGVRAPMAEHDQPIVRPYLLVDDIEAAVSAAEAAGGQIAMPATEIPGEGRFAIYLLDGTQYGLWQN